MINAQLDMTRSMPSMPKISKARSEKATAASQQYDTEAQVLKLENQTQNYRVRNSQLYVTAPQNGYINKAIISGIGET